ncbi:MAG: hypothetical protein KF776_19585 [Burkholderiales bacterium]|nr:hypothetical protein [Burkholderiales bacterium]
MYADDPPIAADDSKCFSLPEPLIALFNAKLPMLATTILDPSAAICGASAYIGVSKAFRLP